MGNIKRFEDLEVWKNSADLVVNVIKLCRTSGFSKDYGTTDQLRRAAFSISNNIAEGFEYDNTKDFIKFLRYAKGSAGEVRNMMNILRKADLIDNLTYKKFYTDLISVSNQIKGFIKYLQDFDKMNRNKKGNSN